MKKNTKDDFILKEFAQEISIMMLKLCSNTDYTISEIDITSLFKCLIKKHYPLVAYSDIMLEFPIPSTQFLPKYREVNGRGRKKDKPKVHFAILPCPTFSRWLVH